MAKIGDLCYTCGAELTAETIQKTGNICKSCKAKYAYTYDRLNKDKLRKSRKALIIKHIAILQEYLAMHPCSACGEANVVVLDYHHVDRSTKSFSISQVRGLTKKVTEEQLIAEIDKCIILCANCHIKHEHFLHANTRQRRMSPVRDEYIKSKDSRCEHCGNMGSLEFHHKISSTKVMGIADMLATGASIEDFIAEMDKCELLCRNCHRILHHKEREVKI
jgi:hypothetical protein